MKKVLSVLLAGVVLGACSNQEEAKVYEIGVVTDRAQEIWEFALEDLDEDFEVDVHLFSDFVQPNIALEEGSIDVNAFQYLTFLHDYNSSNDGNLHSMGYLSAEPSGIWAVEEINSLDDVPEDSRVAIYNDPINSGNSLILLDRIGLIELEEDAPLLPTEEHIESVHGNLEIIQMDPGQVTRSLGDVELIVSGATVAKEGGYNIEDALFSEDMTESSPYTRLNFVVREEDLENEDLQKILDVYQRPEVVEYANETGDGTFYPAWENDDEPSEDYQTYVDYVEDSQ